jgi:hypothetical protein
VSDDPILAAIAALRADFLGELGQTRADIMGKIEGLQQRLDSLDEHLTMGLGGFPTDFPVVGSQM